METPKNLLERLRQVGLKTPIIREWKNIIRKYDIKYIDKNKLNKCLNVLFKRIQDPENTLNKKFEQNYPPIHTAVVFGDLELLKIIVEMKPNNYIQDVEIPDHVQTKTPPYYLLFLATEMGHYDIVEFLIPYIRKPLTSFKNLDGETPLHIAARCGYFEIVEYLVEIAGVDDINFKDGKKNTPIHSLLRNWKWDKDNASEDDESKEKILKLLATKSDLFIEDRKVNKFSNEERKYGMIPLERAIKTENKLAIGILAPLTCPIPKKVIDRCEESDLKNRLKEIKKQQKEEFGKIEAPKEYFEKNDKNEKRIKRRVSGMMGKIYNIAPPEKKQKGDESLPSVRRFIRRSSVSSELSFLNSSSSSLNETNESIKCEPTPIKEEPKDPLDINYNATQYHQQNVRKPLPLASLILGKFK